MSTIDSWQDINRELVSICETLCEHLAPKINFDVSGRIAHAFVLKATRTLKAVTLLYEYRLWEQAQALVRILLELRLNFDCFLKMVAKDPRLACWRVIDSMMLEKIKQQRASNFVGLGLIPSAPSRDDLENKEKEIASRYSPEDLERLKKHGFTGLPIEQRARLTGHEEVYNIVYRNFSRNVHSTDYIEHYMHQESRDSNKFRKYYESRDSISLYTAQFSAGGIAEFANQAYRCGLETELDEIGNKQRALRSKTTENNKLTCNRD